MYLNIENTVSTLSISEQFNDNKINIYIYLFKATFLCIRLNR